MSSHDPILVGRADGRVPFTLALVKGVVVPAIVKFFIKWIEWKLPCQLSGARPRKSGRPLNLILFPVLAGRCGQ
jgi:hypothetical protein